MTVIAVVNESSDLTDRQARLMTKACHRQLERHVAPLWSFEPWPVRFYAREKDVPKDSLAIVLLEDEGEADALGYHAETPNGRRYGRVFTSHLLASGGTRYQSSYSVSVVLSHEVIEAFVDPDLNIWAEGRPGEMWAYEPCDPVQEQAYRVRVDGHLVHVSNFVLPTWFDLENPPRTRYDYLRQLSRPFSIAKGGYAVVWDGEGDEKIRHGQRSRRKKAGRNFVAARSIRRTSSRIHFD